MIDKFLELMKNFFNFNFNFNFDPTIIFKGSDKRKFKYDSSKSFIGFINIDQSTNTNHFSEAERIANQYKKIVSEKDNHIKSQEDLISNLTKSIEYLIKEKENAETQDEKTSFENAIKLIESGDTNKAQSLLLELENKKASEGKEALKEAAKIAVNRSHLMRLENLPGAIRILEDALKYDPQNSDIKAILIEHKIHSKDLFNPEENIRELEELSFIQTSNNEFGKAAISLRNVGIIYDDHFHDLDLALESYSKALDLIKNLPEGDDKKKM